MPRRFFTCLIESFDNFSCADPASVSNMTANESHNRRQRSDIKKLISVVLSAFTSISFIGFKSFASSTTIRWRYSWIYCFYFCLFCSTWGSRENALFSCGKEVYVCCFNWEYASNFHCHKFDLYAIIIEARSSFRLKVEIQLSSDSKFLNFCVLQRHFRNNSLNAVLLKILFLRSFILF